MTLRRGITSALAVLSVIAGCRSVIGLDDLERVDCVDCDAGSADTERDTFVAADTLAVDTFVEETAVAPDTATDDTASPVDSAVAPDTAPDTSAPDTSGPDTSVDAGPTTLVAMRSTWRFVDTGSEPVPSGWTAITYSDIDWKAGPGALGYGDSDLATKIFGGDVDAGTRVITAYFRRSFTVTEPSKFSSLTANLQRDDGAIVYLNGTEIIRSNMPAGAVTSSTFASSSVNSPEESLYNPFLLPATLLRSGTNVLAAEVHQSSLTSSDLRFDLELIAR